MDQKMTKPNRLVEVLKLMKHYESAQDLAGKFIYLMLTSTSNALMMGKVGIESMAGEIGEYQARVSAWIDYGEWVDGEGANEDA